MPIIVVEQPGRECVQVLRRGLVITIKTHSQQIASEVERKVIDALKGQEPVGT